MDSVWPVSLILHTFHLLVGEHLSTTDSPLGLIQYVLNFLSTN